MVGILEVVEPDLAGLADHEGGVDARLHPPGVEAGLVGGEGVLLVALVDQRMTSPATTSSETGA